MDNWIALVKASMKDRKVTQDQLAERLGMSQGGVGHWLNKRRVPSLGDMNRVLAVLGLDDLEVALVIRDKADAPHEDTSAPRSPYYRYPVSNWQCQIHEERRSYGPVRSEPSDYPARGAAFWLPVTGDAMTAPRGLSISEGMLVLVDPAIEAGPGKLVVAQWPSSGRATLRKLVEESGQLYLVALNPTYPKQLFSDDCQIIGVVVQATAKF